jgi:hypothetical protein
MEDEDIEDIMRIVGETANRQRNPNPPGRLSNEEAMDMIARGFTDIGPLWRKLMSMIDKPLSCAIGQVWVPSELLDSDNEVSGDNYNCVISARSWFSEDGLTPAEHEAVYDTVNAVISIYRFMTGEPDDADG